MDQKEHNTCPNAARNLNCNVQESRSCESQKKEEQEIEGGILANINIPDSQLIVEKLESLAVMKHTESRHLSKELSKSANNDFGNGGVEVYKCNEVFVKKVDESNWRSRNKKRKRPSEMVTIVKNMKEKLVEMRNEIYPSLEAEYGLDLPIHLPPFDDGDTYAKNEKAKICNNNPRCMCSLKKATRVLVDKIKTVSIKRVQQYHELIGLDAKESASCLSFIPKQEGRIQARVPPGVCNLGATCYLNSQLQCFASFAPFCQGILALDSSTYRFSSMKSVIYELQKLFARICYGPSKIAVNAEAFVESLGLIKDEMQDPVEFSRLLLDKLEQSLREIKTKGSSKCVLTDIFRGKCRFKTRCLTCEAHSESPDEVFYDLLLPINLKTSTNNKEKQNKKLSGISIQSCVHSYFFPEILEGENQYRCSKCGCSRDATRTIEITELPKILSIQLSRYSYSNGFKSKIKKSVQVDRKLNIKCFDGSEKTFVLVALQHHLGGGADTGHYIAETMDWKIGQWFKHDDAKVIMEENPNLNAKNSKGSYAHITSSASVYNLFYVSLECLRENCQTPCCEPVLDILEHVLNDCDEVEREKEKLFVARSKLVKIFENESIEEDKIWLPKACLEDILELKVPRTYEISKCRHGRLHPNIFKSGKCVSRKSLSEIKNVLQQFYDINDITIFSMATNSALCRECFEIEKITKSKKITKLEKLTNLLYLLKTHSNHTNDNGFVVSKNFIASIKKNITMSLRKDLKQVWSVQEDLDAFVNSSIMCHHNNLHTTPSQYITVPEFVWVCVVDLFSHARTFTCIGGFKCSICVEEKYESKVKIREMEYQLNEWSKRFQSDEVLSSLSSFPSWPEKRDSESFCIVSHASMEVLRDFVYNIQSSTGILDINTESLVSPLFCSHNKVCLPYKFSKALTEETFDLRTLKGPERIELISLAQWGRVCKYIEQLKETNIEVDAKDESRKKIIKPVVLTGGSIMPEMCSECLAAQAEEYNNWESKPILVIKLSPQDVVPSVENIPLETGRRKSKRRDKKSCEIIVSGSDSLAKLRLHIHEQLGENLLDQELFYNGSKLPLEQNHITLEGFGIKPYSLLHLRYINTKYARGIKSQLEDSTLTSLLRVTHSVDSNMLSRKEGFNGTFLGTSNTLNNMDLSDVQAWKKDASKHCVNSETSLILMSEVITVDDIDE